MTLFQLYGDLENKSFQSCWKLETFQPPEGAEQDWSTFKNLIPREWFLFDLSGDLVKDPTGIFIWPMLELTHMAGLLLWYFCWQKFQGNYLIL